MIGKRLIDFLSRIILEGVAADRVPGLALDFLFDWSERDTAVYCYGPYEEPDKHSAADLVVKFQSDSGCKVCASWQGATVTIEGNFPNMGWDYDDGEFGLGGDWWRDN